MGKVRALSSPLSSYSQSTDTKEAWIPWSFLAEESLHYGGSSLYLTCYILRRTAPLRREYIKSHIHNCVLQFDGKIPLPHQSSAGVYIKSQTAAENI